MKSKRPDVYACPLCDESVGPAYTEEELREHFKEDHLEQEGVNDFIKEVEETFTLIMTYIRALKENYRK